MNYRFPRMVKNLRIHGIALCAGGCMLGQSLGHAQDTQVTADQPQMVLQLGHRGSITAVALSRNGRTVATAATDRTVKLWDVRTGELQRTLPEHENEPFMIAFSPDDKQLVTADAQRGLGPEGQTTPTSPKLRFWDAKTGQQVHTVRCRNRLAAIAISPDWKVIAQAEEHRLSESDLIL